MGCNISNKNSIVKLSVNNVKISPNIDYIKTSKISEEHKDYSKKISSRSGLGELALKPTKFYKETIGLSP